jgi:hypothetical protein
VEVEGPSPSCRSCLFVRRCCFSDAQRSRCPCFQPSAWQPALQYLTQRQPAQVSSLGAWASCAVRPHDAHVGWPLCGCGWPCP